MKRLIGLVTMILLLLNAMAVPVFATETQGEKPMQAAWIATVYSLDFPKEKNAAAQKAEFIQKLDTLKKAGINTVVVQVRPKADALYISKINPWSDVLTGTQGKDPGYDPLAFMIEEAHQRGMELHAWLNPYRVTTSGTDVKALHSSHPARLHPEWVISYKNALYYNPELKEVKEHIIATVEELVKNYAVDGIHFDDYFYPNDYPLPAGEKPDGTVAQARRNHVNEMVKGVSEIIKKTNPKVKFGISPMGIWKNQTNDPTGSPTKGKESYYSVFGDTRTWIKEGWIDYVVPQIYWEIGHSLADYDGLVKWWSNEVKGTQVALYIGQGIYKETVAKEIDAQLKHNGTLPEIKGSFYYGLGNLLGNVAGCQEKISAYIASWKPTPVVDQGEVVKPQEPGKSQEPGKPQEPDKTQEPQQPQEQVVTGKTFAAITKIYTERGTENPLLTKVGPGYRLVILQVQDGWYQVKLISNKIGWVPSNQVKLDQ